MSEKYIDPAKTALVVIDLQKGIVTMDTKPYSPDLIISNTNQLIDKFHRLNSPVFLVHVGPSDDNKDRLNPITDQNPNQTINRPADWMDFAPELSKLPSDFIITKRQWGAFYGTELDLQLRRRGIDTIVLCGIATNIGVESTARFAYEYGYNQLIVEDACSTFSTELHNFAFTNIFPRISRIRSTNQIIDSFLN